jgi:hypothetical protein
MLAWRRFFILKENEMRKQAREDTFKSFMGLIIFCGLFGLGAQFLQGMGSMALFAGVPALGGLVATSRIFDEREQQLLNQAFGLAFQWTGVALFVFFAVYEGLKWLNTGGRLIQFMDLHWIGLVFSLMMLLLGVAGRQVFKEH